MAGATNATDTITSEIPIFNVFLRRVLMPSQS